MRFQRILIGCALAAAMCYLPAQTQIDLRTQAKSVDFSNASSTKPSKTGTVLTATCSIGETFVKTDATPGANVYVCTAANVWTVQSSALPGYETGNYGKVLTNDANGMQWQSLDGDVSGDVDELTVKKLQGRPLGSSAPATGNLLGWDGTQWTPLAGATIPTIQGNQPWLCRSTNGTTSYTCSLTASPLTTYTPGMWLTLLADTTNTGAVTLNVDGLGVKDIRQSDGVSNPAPGQVTAGRALTIAYDGACWRLPPYSGVPFGAASNQFVTAINPAGIATTAQPAFSNLTGSVAASQMPALAGDVTSAAGSVGTTLATVNTGPGQCGDATHVCQVTTNAKGLVTQQTAVPLSGFSGISSLNGLSGSNQTFANDSNVTLVSAGNTHTLGWSGLLGLNRGGLNADLSTSGGAHQVLKQNSPGGSVTVGQLSAGDLSGLAASATTDTTNAANIASGTLPAARLPLPAANTLGGVQAKGAQSHYFLTGISSTDGSVTTAQPAAADISGLAASAITDTTNAANISSGTLAAARLPLPAVSTLGGVQAKGAQSHYFLTGISSTDGSVTATQPAAGDINGLAASAITDTTNAANISSGTLAAARLPLPGASALGGVRSKATQSHYFLTGVSSTDGSVSAAQPAAGDISGLAPSATTDTTNASNIISGTLGIAVIPTGITSATVAFGNHTHSGFESTINKDANGGYVGRDASGNVALPGSLTAASFASTDTTHTGKIELTPGTSTNFANSIPSGNFGLFLDSSNSNKLTKRDSSGNDTVIEGAGGGSTVLVNNSPVSNPNLNATTPAAQGGYVNATFQVSASNVSAEVPTGTAAGTLAAGNDSRFVAAGKTPMATDTAVVLTQLPPDFVCTAASASSTDYACNFTGPPAALVQGERYRFKADVPNTAAAGKPTIKFNAFPAIQIVKPQGGVTTALAANDIQSGQYVDCVYDGTNCQMASQLGNSVSGGADPNGYYLVSRSANAPANAVNLGALSSGLVKITASGGVATPSIAVAGDFPTLNQDTTGKAAGLNAPYVDWTAASGGAAILNKPSIPPDVSGAHYLTTQAETGLSAEANLGAGSTGFVKCTISGGVCTPSTAYPTSSDVGLGSVTNDAQTKAAVMPNSAPGAGQVPVGNAGGTAYLPMTLTGDATLASSGTITIAAGAVTPAKSSVAIKTDTWTFNIGTDNASTDLVAADIGPQGRIFMVPVACTISEITVAANAASPSVIVRKNHTGSQTDLLSGTLATAANGAVACAATSSACLDGSAKSGSVSIVTAGSANVLAAGDWIETSSGVASAGAKRLSVAVTCVRN